jgi:hypothetical protein
VIADYEPGASGLHCVVSEEEEITGVPDTISIHILLVWIIDCGAVIICTDIVWITGIAVAVPITVSAVIARIPQEIAVAICLVGIAFGNAVIAEVADIISIAVGLILVRCKDAVVAGIADAVPVMVMLRGIGIGRAIIDAIGITVAV